MDRRAALLRIVIPRRLADPQPDPDRSRLCGRRRHAGRHGGRFGWGPVRLQVVSWKLVRGLSGLAEAAISWDQVAPVFRAAGLEETAPPAALGKVRREPRGRLRRR